MPRALVTGANGFIGRHLIDKLLSDGWRVKALLHNDSRSANWPDAVTVITGDIRDGDDMKSACSETDIVFHLAAKVHALSEIGDDDAAYQAVNVDGTRNVLEKASASRVRGFVLFSSVKAMGEENTLCLDESSDASPSTAYGRSKQQAEQVVMEHGRQTGMHVVTLRLPLVYGPGNKGNLFRMISAIDAGRFPPLPDTGNLRSMVHVSNVVDAAILAATHPRANGQCYIVADVRAHSTREIQDLIRLGLGKKKVSWHVPLALLKAMALFGDAIGKIRGQRFSFDSDALQKLVGSSLFDANKISHELDYLPTITFEGAIPELIEWYQRQADHPSANRRNVL